jgi:hypothetical protein
MSSLRDCLVIIPRRWCGAPVRKHRTVNHQRIYFSLLPKTVRRLMAPGLWKDPALILRLLNILNPILAFGELRRYDPLPTAFLPTANFSSRRAYFWDGNKIGAQALRAERLTTCWRFWKTWSLIYFCIPYREYVYFGCFATILEPLRGIRIFSTLHLPCWVFSPTSQWLPINRRQ